MMGKQMSYKKIIICVCAVAAIIAVAVIVLLSKKEETFRSILVYDVEGTAVIERETVGAMNAAENLYLESGDRVSVAADSSMRMKLDDDKYVMAEADTVFSVEAEGTEENSKTRICLKQGAITNEIQHPLSEGSQYETSTPNSVMAVRGTIYRVELYVDENGDQNTKLCCFQGKVGAKPVLPDGTYGEEVLVPAGSELIIYADGTMSDIRDIAYEELPAQAIGNLTELLESGQSMEGISLENLSELTSGTQNADATSKKSETDQSETAEMAKEASQSEADTKAEADVHTAKSAPAQNARNTRNHETTQAVTEQPVQKPQEQTVTPPKAVEPISSSGYNTQQDSSQDDNNDSGQTDDNPSNSDQSDKDKPSKDKPDKDKDKPSRPEVYTVTFLYQGSVFATQEVLSGETVAAPVLIPARDGAWDFDFGTKIEADTTVSWK